MAMKSKSAGWLAAERQAFLEGRQSVIAQLKNPHEAVVFAAERALRDRWTKPARDRVLGVARAIASTLDETTDKEASEIR